MNDVNHMHFPAVVEGRIGNIDLQVVDARELHGFLKVGRAFGAWITDRIEKYGFAEGVDYATFAGLSVPNPESSKSRSQETKEYTLCLDMAKELAMVENNERGRQVRRYFISMERKAHAGITADDLLANPTQLLAIAQGYALQIEDMKRDMTVMKADVDAFDRIGRADGLYGVRQTSQVLQIPERKFIAWAMQNEWLFRQNGSRTLMGYADKRKAGYIEHKLETYTKPDGEEGTRELVKFTPAGISRLAKLLNRSVQGDLLGSEA